MTELEAAVGVHAAFVVRFGRGLLPSAETVVQDGDLVYASVLSRDIHDVADKAAISPVDGL
jgi:trk system potassium uptake protein TrkA